MYSISLRKEWFNMLLKHFMWEQDEYEQFVVEEKTPTGWYKKIWDGFGSDYEDQYGDRKVKSYEVFEDYILVTLEDGTIE